MTDDDPLDLAQVAADDLELDAVRLQSVRPDDTALQLLRDLLADIDRELPDARPVGRGSTVLRLANESTRDPRVARSGAVVALITAGVVALGGVAAASTAVAPGNPLHGLGETVRSAAGAVVTAVKPPKPAQRDELPALPTPAASRAVEVRPTAAPGPDVAAAARSTAAVRQVTAHLDAAEELIRSGRTAAAQSRLDAAERRLAEVAATAAEPLRARLAELRVSATSSARSQQQAPAPKPAARPSAKAKAEPRAERAQDAPEDAKPADKPADRPAARPEPSDRAPKAGLLTPHDAPPGAQPSKLASTKPRA